MVGGTGMSGISGLKKPETPFSMPRQVSRKKLLSVPGRMEVGSRKNRPAPVLVVNFDIEEALEETPELTAFSTDLPAFFTVLENFLNGMVPLST